MNLARTSPDALLTYRPWRGHLSGPWYGAFAIARRGLAGLARRKLVWVLYAFCVLIFFSFFFGQYLLVWAESQVSGAGENVRMVGFMRVNPGAFVKNLRVDLKLNGSAETFRNLFWFEGSILIVTLALVGAQLIGNDFRHRSLPFYLAKPLAPRHYVAGKCLAVAAVVLAMTALPAVALYVEYGLLDSWEYFWLQRRLLLGILGYGAIIAATLSILLVAVTSWVQKTIPLIMVWSALFIMAPAVGHSLAEFKDWPNARIVDIWNSAYVVGNAMLGLKLERQPPVWICACELAAVCACSLALLARRVRAVEVV